MRLEVEPGKDAFEPLIEDRIGGVNRLATVMRPGVTGKAGKWFMRKHFFPLNWCYP